MAILRFALKQTQLLIYAIFLVILLYFPFHELLSYFGRETRLFDPSPMMPVEDALLPCLLLALVYGVISAIRKRVDSPGAQEASSSRVSNEGH